MDCHDVRVLAETISSRNVTVFKNRVMNNEIGFRDGVKSTRPFVSHVENTDNGVYERRGR